MGRLLTETVNCECRLEDRERLQYGKQLAAEMSKLHRLQERLASFRSQINAQIKQANAQINVLSEKLNSGVEYRDIECDVTYNWETKEKMWWRRDTRELARQDIIPEAELQEELEIASDAQAAADKQIADRVSVKDAAAGKALEEYPGPGTDGEGEENGDG